MLSKEPISNGRDFARSEDSARGAPVLKDEITLANLEEAGLWRKGHPLRLHLGCGEQHLEGYLNIDYSPDNHTVMNIRADAHADILQLEFPPESVDEIRLHHVFEHFNRVTALALLLKWHTWLKVGGQLRIETPDIAGSARALTSRKSSWKTKMAAVRHLAGDQTDAWAYHLDHWFPERFTRTLKQIGFKSIKTQTSSWPHEPYLANVEVTANKETKTACEQLQAADALLWESAVAENERPTWEKWTRQLRGLLEGSILTVPLNVLQPDISRVLIQDSRWPGKREGRIAQAVRRILGGGKPVAELPLEKIHSFNQDDRDKWIKSKAAAILPGKLVLDVGAGTCPYRQFFAHCQYRAHDFKKYEGVKLGNIREYGQIDYVSDITAIPLEQESFDVILCTEVLEHVPEPISALKEMARLLKTGGRLLLTAPLGSGLHQLPYHFYGGFTPEWYKYFGPKFSLQVTEILPNGGFFKLLAQECARFSWTFEEHRHCHPKNARKLRQLFGETLPRYLFALDEKHFNAQFTVGYHVEMLKIPHQIPP